jgi:hypothetical protein
MSKFGRVEVKVCAAIEAMRCGGAAKHSEVQARFGRAANSCDDVRYWRSWLFDTRTKNKHTSQYDCIFDEYLCLDETEI